MAAHARILGASVDENSCLCLYSNDAIGLLLNHEAPLNYQTSGASQKLSGQEVKIIGLLSSGILRGRYRARLDSANLDPSLAS